jgi:hypothetical protein
LKKQGGKSLGKALSVCKGREEEHRCPLRRKHPLREI